ncbi:U2 small nuclear ribonucleoprotein auxiliary factor 35 kDa subunit-related protein 1-like isoform X2 [Dreissena polymorpha]|uniref:U2 small nuclear ribonucleoprotein auxiliary factor 35 kDa subunit-related protein 1-like isoform X2 n=1 Tax=Dreissena polymorpha TaxID=45954 RepID=UPI002263B712|nr:U2 small nuclear ribonucleoprotein auxiliary factor 35 kDa subunit-related protein 1-like isoform X2 [Dreissena polymorpha]XP_052219257.1 U2 small nuclear ribonucleoprotein auxiliary factor 35 kDa subunit-related protein 1-like isoform X2 [Dreissena polymorpha]
MIKNIASIKQGRWSPGHEACVAREEEELRQAVLEAEAESHRQRELWEWHEERYREQLRLQAEQREREHQQRLDTERKIKEEWEERQRKEKEEEEETRKKKEKQDELLKQAREAENKDGDWSNPLGPIQYSEDRQQETCPFFTKVGACRFGDRCSRAHPYPDQSRTVMFSGMFRHFQLDQGLSEEYDTDIVLEYEDSDVYQKFREFYEDTLPEFRSIGSVVQFKVCCNYQPHLRGNVYVAYSRTEDALQTLSQFNARWYEGKQLSGQLVEIKSWRRAICGLFGKGKCPKGKECNFLHVFKNPSSEFNMADRDMEPFTTHNYRHRNQEYHNAERSSRFSRYRHSRSRESSKSTSHRHSVMSSRSRSRESRRSQRTRSRERSRRSRSRSEERSRHGKNNRRSVENLRRSSSKSLDKKSFSKKRSPSRESSKREVESMEDTPENGSEGSRTSSLSSNDDCDSQKQMAFKRSTDTKQDHHAIKKYKKHKNNKHKKKEKVAQVDNIEHYEQTVCCEDYVWVEKTIEDKP